MPHADNYMPLTGSERMLNGDYVLKLIEQGNGKGGGALGALLIRWKLQSALKPKQPALDPTRPFWYA